MTPAKRKAWGIRPALDNVPPIFRAWPRWVVWRAEPRKGAEGKVDKVPYIARTGFRASTTEPKHWCTFDVARAAYEAHPDVLSGVGLVITRIDGAGAALNGLPLFALDIDHSDASHPLIPQLRKLGCYLERSPSGNGIRALGFGPLRLSFVNHQLGVEVYDGTGARFVTVTGRTDLIERPPRV